ncbi:MAG: ATP synthase F1 subunit delta [Oscillospiraceae bacterium]|nr:ATP synthase F1 subunit delta [Oscillospiraceae bacterium]
MTQLDSVYSTVLYSLGPEDSAIADCSDMLHSSPQLIAALDNPCIAQSEKEKVIDCLFSPVLRSFMKVLCANNTVSRIFYIFDEYKSLVMQHENIIEASLTYVTMPQASQLDALKTMLCKTYSKSDAHITLKHDVTLMGGFILQAGDYRYDRSFARQLENIKHELIRG